MAATDSTVFPPINTAYRCYFCIRSSATSNPITGGLTGLSTSGNSQISKDGATFVNSTNNPVEIGTSGYGYLDVTATEMNYSTVVIRIAATNANAIEFSREIVTGGIAQMAGTLATLAQLTTDYAAIIAAINALPSASSTASAVWSVADGGPISGRATTRGPILDQIWRYLYNQNTVNKLTQIQTVYQDDSSTPSVNGTVYATSTQTTKGKLS